MKIDGTDIVGKPELGHVPYLPRHNHFEHMPCGPGCPVGSYQVYLERFGDPPTRHPYKYIKVYIDKENYQISCVNRDGHSIGGGHASYLYMSSPDDGLTLLIDPYGEDFA